MMRMRKNPMFFAAVAALGAVLSGQTARAVTPKDMLDLIPEDAWGFVIASSLDNVDAKATKFGAAFGLPVPEGVSTMALAPLNLADQVDRKSPICAVLMDAQKYAGPDKAAVLLIASEDPKALLEKLGAEEATDGISKCMVMGDVAYAAVRKKIIILGPSQDCVTKVAKATKSIGDSAAKARLAVLDKSDIYLSISLASIVNAYKDQFLPMVQMMTAATDPEGKGLKRMVKMLTEVSAFDLAVTFDDGGLSLRMLVNPVSDSDMQKMMADSKSTSDPLLAGLPKENFLFSMGSTGNQSEHAAKFASESPIGDLLKMTQMAGMDADSVKALDAELVKLQKSIERYAASISALPDGDDGMFGVTLIAETADSGKFIESIRKAYESAWKVTSDEEVAEFKKCVTHKADAETVAGNKVDTITVDLVKFGESQDSDPAELKQAEVLFGKEIVIRFGAGDDRRAIIAFGGGKERYERVCKSLTSSADSLAGDSGIGAVSGQLPSPRSGEMYIAVDSVLQVVNKIAKAVGEDPMPFEVPAVNMPLAGSSTVQGDVMRLDFVIPMKLIKAGKDAYDKYAATMQSDDFDEEDDAAEADESAESDEGSDDSAEDADEDADQEDGGDE